MTAPLHLLRTVRLDASDTFVFERAADGGEWAVPGSFLFWSLDPAGLTGKARSAFRSGFLGLASFGFSTLAIVNAATAQDREAATALLAARLLAQCGAPDAAAARAAAEDEIAFAATLAEHPQNTLVALHRALDPDGAVRERFRTLRPGRPVAEVRAFSFVPVTGEDGDGEGPEPPEEHVDLAGLLARGRAGP